MGSSDDKEKIDVESLVNFFWTEGDLRYKIDEMQESIGDTVRRHFNDAKKICILSSRQIGKSYWVMTFALEYLIRNPKTICRVIAPTREKCEEIVEDNLNVILNDVPEGFISRSTSKNRWNLWNGSSLRLGALERQYVDKNRGGNASLIIYEECGFVSGDDFIYGVNSVIGPQLLRSRGHEIFVSSPSEQPDHPLHTVVAPACELMGTLFRYMVFESPSISDPAIVEAAERSGTKLTVEFVSEVRRKVKEHATAGGKIIAEEVHEIAARDQISLSDGFKREYMAEIIRPTSLMVIPRWNERTTVVESKPPVLGYWQTVIDWGGVRDMTVGYLMTYMFTGDIDFFWDERVYPPNTNTDTIMAGFKNMESQWASHWNEDDFARWADVPGQIQTDLYREHGYQTQLPEKANWMAGCNNMADRFGRDRVRINPRCKFLIASVRAGIFNRTRTDFERTETLGHMDGLAAAMYGMRMLNRENPMPAYEYAPDNLKFVNPTINNDDNGLSSLGGKTFGKFAK